MSNVRYKRILLKISGESLMGEDTYGIDVKTVDRIASEISQACDLGIAIVIGGGNIYRGAALASDGMHKITGDHIGMLATVMNALAISDAFKRNNIPSNCHVRLFRLVVAFVSPFNHTKAKICAYAEGIWSLFLLLVLEVLALQPILLRH